MPGLGQIATGPARCDSHLLRNPDTYQVAEVRGRWTCSCPWGRYKGSWKHCSHVVAVRRAAMDPMSQAPVARLAEMLVTRLR